MQFSVVITTVFLPRVLERFASNLGRFGRKDDVEILVIGDRKSPHETGDFVRSFRLQGFSFEYWDVPAQEKWLARWSGLAQMIPYDSDNRRNVGYLLAYDRGRECIVIVDDDNYPTDDDYFGAFEGIGVDVPRRTVASSSGWFNNMTLLKTDPPLKAYPRGYPYKQRWRTDEKLTWSTSSGRLAVKAGMWLGDPDVDAVTRVTMPLSATALLEPEVALARGTRCPYNTQNTAVHRSVIPAYYYVPMGDIVDGFRIDRYGDIWSSYISQKVIDHLNDRVAFGTPLTHHARHDHDLLKDLGQEYPGMVMTDRFVDILESISLVGSDYFEATADLAGKLASASTASDWTLSAKAYVKKICRNLLRWVDVCRDLDGASRRNRTPRESVEEPSHA